MAAVQVGQRLAPTPEYAQVNGLIDQALALIQEPERQIDKVHLFLSKIIPLVQGIDRAGASNTVRYMVYSLIQAQKDSDGALYKELKCPIHLDLIGDYGPPTTLPCGHSFCTECIRTVAQSANPSNRKCPFCRVLIAPGTQFNPTVAIGLITDRLKPRAPAGGFKGKKKMKTRKHKRNL